MKLTYFGHSCFLVEIQGTRLLFDPFITPNPLAAKIDLGAIQPDVILVSHGHFDHLADVEQLAGPAVPVICNWEISDWLSKKGVSNIVAMNHGGQVSIPCGTVKMVNAIHSSTLPDGHNGGNPAGFVVDSLEGAFYYSGDTALTLDMKLIAEDFSVRFAVLPVGDTFTMGARDAAKAAEFVGTTTVVGVHYDTFPPIRIDHEAARKEFAMRDLSLLLPAIGESVEI